MVGFTWKWEGGGGGGAGFQAWKVLMEQFSFLLLQGSYISRDGKMYERAANARVNFFIVWVKSVTNSTLFCRKSELFCNFKLFGVMPMALIWKI